MSEERPPLVDPVTPDARDWQRPLVQRLLDLQHRAQLPHALMIEPGSRSDSRDFGWLLAQALMCRSDSGQPCGGCESCRLMAANSHPDFSFVTLERNPKREGKLNRDITVDQIRDLIHRLSLTGSQGQGRIALIYPAERMNREAANSLLKTLEEPAPGSTLILLTHHAARLPITIRSRCQYWRVDRPPREQARAWLRDHGIDDDQIDAALELAGDDPEYALELAGSGFVAHYREFEQQLDAFLGERIDAVQLVQQQKQLDSAAWRQLLSSSLGRRIRETAASATDPRGKQRLRQLLELQARSDRPLQVEETNLNLQLQLEDLLISLKHAVNRG